MSGRRPSPLVAIACLVLAACGDSPEAPGETETMPSPPDFTIRYIQRLPVMEVVPDAADPTREGWPAPGERVTWRAHVHNRDWAHGHVRVLGHLFRNAVYQEAPDGVLDRFRLDRVTVVPDGSLETTQYGDRDDRTVDMRWALLAEHVEWLHGSDGYSPPSARGPWRPRSVPPHCASPGSTRPPATVQLLCLS